MEPPPISPTASDVRVFSFDQREGGLKTAETCGRHEKRRLVFKHQSLFLTVGTCSYGLRNAAEPCRMDLSLCLKPTGGGKGPNGQFRAFSPSVQATESRGASHATDRSSL